MNAQLTTVRDGARASARTPERQSAEAHRARAAAGPALARAHRRPEEPGQDHRDHEANERREDQQQDGVSVRYRFGVEGPAAQSDGDRHRRPDGGDVHELDPAAVGVVVARQSRRPEGKRNAGDAAEERGDRPGAEQRMAENRPGRLPGAGGDQGHDQRSEGRSEDRADQRHRADLAA